MDRKPVASRNIIFDYLRIILILLVVNLHIRIVAFTKPNILENYVVFAVPLFLVLSFYLTGKYFIYSRLNLTQFIKRIKRLFVPFIFWSLAGLIIHPELLDLRNILIQLITGEVVNVPLYYLVLLICFTVMAWTISYCKPRVQLAIYLVILLICFYMQYSALNYNIFKPMTNVVYNSYGRFVELFPYVPLGLIFHYVYKNQNKHKLLVLILFISFLFLISSFYLNKAPGFRYSGLTTYFITSCLFSIVLIFSRFNPPLQIDLISKYTFGVYLFHFIALELLIRLYPQIKLIINIYPIPFLLAFTLTCYSFCYVIDRISRHKLLVLIA